MRITESRLREVIRSVINEASSESFKAEDEWKEMGWGDKRTNGEEVTKGIKLRKSKKNFGQRYDVLERFKNSFDIEGQNYIKGLNYSFDKLSRKELELHFDIKVSDYNNDSKGSPQDNDFHKHFKIIQTGFQRVDKKIKPCFTIRFYFDEYMFDIKRRNESYHDMILNRWRFYRDLWDRRNTSKWIPITNNEAKNLKNIYDNLNSRSEFKKTFN